MEAESPGDLLESLRQIGITPELVVDIGCKFFDTLLQEENMDSIYNNTVLKKDNAEDNANLREDEYYELLKVEIRFMPPDCLS